MLKQPNKKYTTNPSLLNQYNKFLTTLDQHKPINEIQPINEIYPKNNNTSNNIQNINSNSEDEVKKTIDLIVQKITENFNSNDYKCHQYTGQTNKDILMSKLEINDPNYYQDISIKTKPSYKVDLHIPKNENNSEIKETIFIDTEINCISDLLLLIEKYKIKPDIKYNINMKALHEIKVNLEELNNMIGMEKLKTNIVYQILYFIQGLHKNKNTGGDFMHTVIYGPPGTGKTEIAKIIGKIYSKIGILQNGTFKKVTRSDLVAGYLGQTALKTRDIIKEAIGGVLFIDEAYALGNPDKKDSFAKECIDTLCEALSDYKENLMVIIAGYESELKDCFFNYNQGLDSRFTWRFKTDDYNETDLYNIFIKKVKDIGWKLSEDSKITVEWFKKHKEYFIFFGRDIETVLAKTKIAHSKRVFCLPEQDKRKINIIDLNKGFEMYLNNDDVKNRKDNANNKKYLYSTLYS
uniref:AAA+ ATPase domain-containing protein n=1 Tax=viral metagenome TaxID=1070528 RepID=A0A6C0IH39_9ZZZZ